MFHDLIAQLLFTGAKLEDMGKVQRLLREYTLSENSLTLAFVEIRLLDHEAKFRNGNNGTREKILHMMNQGQKKGNFDRRETLRIVNTKRNNKFEVSKRTYTIKSPTLWQKRPREEWLLLVLKSTPQQSNETKRTPQTMQAAQPSMENTYSLAFIVEASDRIINRENIASNVAELNS